MKIFKRKMPILFSLCLAIICCALPLTACADSETPDGEQPNTEQPNEEKPNGEKPFEKVAGTAGLEYTLSDDGEYYYLSGLGSAKDEEEIVIANYYNDKPVKQIGKYTWMTEEELMSAVTESGIDPNDLLLFKDSKVKRITVSEGTTTMGSYVFGEIKNNTVIVESVSLPNSLTTICAGAFANCHSLESITIPNNVTSICDGAFAMCTSITTVTITNGVTSIGGGAFSNCSSLTSIIIPNSVTTIGEGAFAYCSSLSIYCEVEEKPSGWNESWNDDRPVVWGYKGNK